jgi:hypothetical protein
MITPEADQRHRVPRDRPRASFGVVLATPRAEQEQRRERPDRTGQVDHGGAGEVHHRLAADVGEQATAPDRMGDERVDHGAEDDRVDHVGPELDPLQGRTPDDRQRDRAEGEAVEHQHRRFAGHQFPGDALVEVEEETAVAEDLVAAAFRDPVTDRPPGNRADGEVDEDLGDAGAGVLLSREADLEEHEARLHQEHEDAGDGDPDHVQLGGLFGGGVGQGRGGGRSRYDKGDQHRDEHGEAQLLIHRSPLLCHGRANRRAVGR